MEEIRVETSRQATVPDVPQRCGLRGVQQEQTGVRPLRHQQIAETGEGGDGRDQSEFSHPGKLPGVGQTPRVQPRARRAWEVSRDRGVGLPDESGFPRDEQRARP